MIPAFRAVSAAVSGIPAAIRDLPATARAAWADHPGKTLMFGSIIALFGAVIVGAIATGDWRDPGPAPGAAVVVTRSGIVAAPRP